MSTSMESHCLPASQLPHTSRLFADFLQDFARVARFYARPPTVETMVSTAPTVRADAGVLRGVVEVLREQNERFGADEAVRRNLARLAAGAVAVVTGQQVGLFGGPAYSVYKALTAFALARELTAKGADAVPVFWLATEDHDVAEVDHTFLLGANRYLQRIGISVSAADGRCVGEIPLGESIGDVLHAAKQNLRGFDNAPVIRWLEESYASEETFGSAFGKLMARLFAGRGIILLDALDARLHQLAQPLYRRALEENRQLNADLLARNKALEKARYHAQVKVTESSTLLFLKVADERRPLRVRNSMFSAGRDAFSLEDLLRLVDSAPERFSANALFRSVVQDFLLPTAVYVGGPAEVAYFAQSEVLYRRLLDRMPVVVPRAGFTLVEPHIARLLKKYNLHVRDVWQGRQRLRAHLERQFLPRALARQFTDGEAGLRKMFQKLRRPVGKLDRTLLGALDTSERKVLYQLWKLRAKAGRAENFRTGALDNHERILLDALYPHRGLQERTLSALGFVAAHGADLLDALECRSVEQHVHHILFL